MKALPGGTLGKGCWVVATAEAQKAMMGLCWSMALDDLHMFSCTA